MQNMATHYTHDLSVLIPGRNEEWLSETLVDMLKAIRANTEIIVVLDGETFPKELPTDPRIKYSFNRPTCFDERSRANSWR